MNYYKCPRFVGSFSSNSHKNWAVPALWSLATANSDNNIPVVTTQRFPDPSAQDLKGSPCTRSVFKISLAGLVDGGRIPLNLRPHCGVLLFDLVYLGFHSAWNIFPARKNSHNLRK